MAEQIYSQSTRKILQNKKLIEDSLKIKISAKNNIVTLEGKGEDEYIGLKVIEAINLGFPVPKALLLKEEDVIFEKVLIKSIAKRKDLSQVRARIIGTQRKALTTIEDLTGTIISVHENTVGIIGRYDDMQKALFVIKRIIAGSKHANMYAWLENQKILEKSKFE